MRKAAAKAEIWIFSVLSCKALLDTSHLDDELTYDAPWELHSLNVEVKLCQNVFQSETERDLC
jgi:hypothetical protein